MHPMKVVFRCAAVPKADRPSLDPVDGTKWPGIWCRVLKIVVRDWGEQSGGLLIPDQPSVAEIGVEASVLYGVQIDLT